MNTTFRYIFVVMILLLVACSPSIQPVLPTATESPTLTSIPTKTPTPKPEDTLTAPPTQSEKVITKMEWEKEMEAFDSAMKADLFTMPKDSFNEALEGIQKMDTAFTCPEVWIGDVHGKPNPFYGLIIKTVPEKKEKSFVYAIRPTVPEMEPYSFLGVVTIPPNTDENIFVTVEYQTPSGEANPDELEINLVYPGCEIYKETVFWP